MSVGFPSNRTFSTVCLLAGPLLLPLLFLATASGQSEAGIPVTDPLVKEKCGGCHPSDERGNMRRISWERSSPEGWEQALKRMTLLNDVDLTPGETKRVLQYLNTDHGLAPAEARAVMYDVERRIHEETGFPEGLVRSCGRCHNLARSLSWRRSADDWKEFSRTHSLRYNFLPNDEATEFLAKIAPLHTSEWSTWQARDLDKNMAGRWLVTATALGRLIYFGEMQVESTGENGEFKTRTMLQSIRDGSTIIRSGRGVVFGAYAWRGSSKADTAGIVPAVSPDALSNESTDVMTIGEDQVTAQGRWFWGQYQELGFDVRIRRASSDVTLLAIDRPLLKTGSKANFVRLIGDHFPRQISRADVVFGPGVTVRRIVSSNATEVTVELDVATDAMPGKRSVAFRGSVLPDAFAVYQRVDYIKVIPESATAAFGNQTRSRGYQQFEAIGYLTGPDGKRHTKDDVDLGPVDVTWSMKVFYESEGSRTDSVGTVSPTGFFVPAVNSPGNNFDVWVIADAKTDKGKDGEPLVGKSYLVVTVPFYVFNGRRYVRDLDRWIDDGPAQERK